MLIDKMIAKFLPCEKIIHSLIEEHALTIQSNNEALDRLLKASSNASGNAAILHFMKSGRK